MVKMSRNTTFRTTSTEPFIEGSTFKLTQTLMGLTVVLIEKGFWGNRESTQRLTKEELKEMIKAIEYAEQENRYLNFGSCVTIKTTRRKNK